MSYQRSLEEKRRLKNLYEETKTCYGGGCYFDTSTGRYVRYSLSRNTRRPSYLKRRFNKKVRRARLVLQRGKFRRHWNLKNELY